MNTCLNPNGTIDRRAVMALAWRLYRDVSNAPALIAKALKQGFKANRTRWINCLKAAWSNARYYLKQSRKTAEQLRAEALEQIEARILSLQMVDTLGHREASLLPQLIAARHEAEALRAA